MFFQSFCPHPQPLEHLIFPNITIKQLEKTQQETFSQPHIQNAQNESHEGLLYETSLENTLKNIKNSSRFFETVENMEYAWIWNGKHNKMLGGSRVQIEKKDYDFASDFQKSLHGTARKC